ncbi:hypothetical protein [Mycobacterium sp. SMC-19]|uniref:hypothetical protein n=1 Tax=Mycobacterium sp. SMC-19 TaxID=3381630 RepID=UPI003876782F
MTSREPAQNTAGQGNGKSLNQSLIESAQEFRDSIEALIELAALVDDSARRLDDDKASFERRLLLAHPSLDDAGRLYERLISKLESALQSARRSRQNQTSSEEKTAPTNNEIAIEIDLSDLIEEYGLDLIDSAMLTISRVRRARATVAFNSLLVAAVGEFEALCYQCIKNFVRKYPAKLSSSTKEFTFEEVNAFGDLDDFKAHAIDVYAEAIMRGSVDDWLKWFATNIKLQSSDVTDDWDQFFEIFQRRHLLVHNGGVVSRLYRKKVKILPDDIAATGPGLEPRAEVTRSYLQEALARLHVAGLLLAIRTSLCIEPPKRATRPPSDPLIADVSFEFLQQNRGRELLLFSDRALPYCTEEGIRLLLQVNLWIQRKRDNGVESIRDEVTQWDVRHCSQRFEIAKFALLNMHRETNELGKRLVAQDTLTQSEWDSWPLFEESRAWAEATSGTLQESQAAPEAEEGDEAMGRP